MYPKQRITKQIKGDKNMTDIEIIYCGDEYTAEFLVNALAQLGIRKTEIFTEDGEYLVEVRVMVKAD